MHITNVYFPVLEMSASLGSWAEDFDILRQPNEYWFSAKCTFSYVGQIFQNDIQQFIASLIFAIAMGTFLYKVTI